LKRKSGGWAVDPNHYWLTRVTENGGPGSPVTERGGTEFAGMRDLVNDTKNATHVYHAQNNNKFVIILSASTPTASESRVVTTYMAPILIQE
jgi:hypothetical protein